MFVNVIVAITKRFNFSGISYMVSKSSLFRTNCEYTEKMCAHLCCL